MERERQLLMNDASFPCREGVENTASLFVLTMCTHRERSSRGSETKSQHGKYSPLMVWIER